MADSGYIINETALAANKTSTIIELKYKRTMSFVYKWTGTLEGTLALQCRNHVDQDWTPVNNATWPSDPASGGGNDEVAFTDAEMNYYRVVFTRSSGTGDLEMYCQSKHRAD